MNYDAVPRFRAFGLEFIGGTVQAQVGHLLDLSDRDQELGPRTIFTLNIQHLALLDRYPGFRNAYANATDIVLDSRVLELWLRLVLRVRVARRLTGADLLPEMCRGLRGRRRSVLKIFFIGPAEIDARTALGRIDPDGTAFELVGATDIRVGGDGALLDAGKGTSTATTLQSTIRRSGADVVAVCLGAPKSELFTARYLSSLRGVRLVCCIGAAVDFLSGRKRRAPVPLQQLGLEWAWRLAAEPRRLWARYTIDAIPALSALTRDARSRLIGAKR